MPNLYFASPVRVILGTRDFKADVVSSARHCPCGARGFCRRRERGRCVGRASSPLRALPYGAPLDLDHGEADCPVFAPPLVDHPAYGHDRTQRRPASAHLEHHPYRRPYQPARRVQEIAGTYDGDYPEDEASVAGEAGHEVRHAKRNIARKSMANRSVIQLISCRNVCPSGPTIYPLKSDTYNLVRHEVRHSVSHGVG